MKALNRRGADLSNERGLDMLMVLIVVLTLLLALACRVVVCLLREPHFVIGKPGSV